MVTEFANEADADRYVMLVGGEMVAVLDYRIRIGAISLTRAFTMPAHRGKGYAAQLVAHALGEIERTTELRVVPMCSFVADWFDKHPERAGLLQR